MALGNHQSQTKKSRAKPSHIWASLGKFGQVRASWAKLSQLEPWQNKNETLKKLLGKCKWQREGKKFSG